MRYKYSNVQILFIRKIRCYKFYPNIFGHKESDTTEHVHVHTHTHTGQPDVS